VGRKARQDRGPRALFEKHGLLLSQLGAWLWIVLVVVAFCSSRHRGNLFYCLLVLGQHLLPPEDALLLGLKFGRGQYPLVPKCDELD
jgi:hypothetical protein